MRGPSPAAVAESPLVKTAIHGADPNWGRIVSAAGYAGVPFQEEEVSLWINEVPVYRRGAPVPFDEAALSGSLRGRRQVDLRLAVGLGRGRRPLLDMRPDGRVRPAERGLHDLSRRRPSPPQAARRPWLSIPELPRASLHRFG